MQKYSLPFKTAYLPILLAIVFLLVPQVRKVFLDQRLRWLYILLLSGGLSYALTPLFAHLARTHNVLDQPEARKIHRSATPLLGGAAVFIAFLASILLNGIFSIKLIVLLTSATILFCLSLADDIREIPAGLKLAAQIGCALIVMAGGIVLKVIPMHLGWISTAANAFLTLLWIVGLTNAMNFFDGMDGLAAGLGAIIAFFLGIVAFQTNQPFLGWVAVALLGCCMGFLPYNFRINGGALIFLGDAGSTVIGFILASLAVYGNWSPSDPVVALASPLLIFWILIFDMVHITIDRILTGKVLNLRDWIEYVGQDHLHHRIAFALGGKKKSVLFIYLMAICLGASALIIRNANLFETGVLLLQAVIMVVLITVLEHRGRYLARVEQKHNREPEPSPLSQGQDRRS